jgi:hypothetical protein
LVGDGREKELPLAISRHSNKHQKEWRNVVGVARDFNCECGAVRKRVGERMSSAGGARCEDGGRHANHSTLQFMTVTQK